MNPGLEKLHPYPFEKLTQLKQSITQETSVIYLCPETPISNTELTAGLYSQQNITVLLGSFLSRSIAAGNTGENRIGVALVAEIEQCVEAANRICDFIKSI